MKKLIYSILSLLSFVSYAQINQKGQNIPYFNSYTSPSVWNSFKSDVYEGGGANFMDIGSDVPVDMSQGKGSLVFESTLPSGYWNLIFRIGNGIPVDYKRMGNTPFLHLRLKWTTIAPGADLMIELITNKNDIEGGFPEEFANVLLSAYTTPTLNWTDVYIPINDFIIKNPKINLSRVAFIKFLGQGTYTTTNKMFVEEMEIVPSAANPYLDAIKVNQIGYLPHQEKNAIVRYELGKSSLAPTTFSIVPAQGGVAVFTGTLTRKLPFNTHEWGQDGDEVYHANFTSFSSPGKYKIKVDQLNQTSQEFEINDTAYNKVFRDALRFFYYSRSGSSIEEPFAEGHTRNALYASGNNATYEYKTGTRDILGGWFDAGDMHMDAHAPVEAVWWLLETLEQFENKVKPGGLNIPESQANVSDLYELVKYELDWYLKMKNPDGSVHFFVNQNLGQVTPSVSDVSSSSAAIAAALFAKAYPLFKQKSIYTSYANTLLVNAKTSWDWLIAHPNNEDPIDPATNKPYVYAKNAGQDQAMRAFAAIELFNATGEAQYNNWFTSRFNNPLSDYFDNQAWGGIISGLEQQEINLGYMDYINSPQPTANTSIIQTLKNAYITQANWTIERIGYTPYNIPLAAPNHLFWGSSGLIATHAYIYDQAYKWTNDVKYKNAIPNAVDWILGRNPVNRIFVTGYGDQLHGTDLYSFYWSFFLT